MNGISRICKRTGVRNVSSLRAPVLHIRKTACRANEKSAVSGLSPEQEAQMQEALKNPEVRFL
jgi:hypothetical protein